jgi:hypothetical protein
VITSSFSRLERASGGGPRRKSNARKLAIAKWKPGMQVVIMRGDKEVAAFPFNPWGNEIEELIKLWIG